jgi:hypothetical protein
MSSLRYCSGCKERNHRWLSKLLHVACWLFVIRDETSDRAHFFIRFAFLASLIGSILGRVFEHVFCCTAESIEVFSPANNWMPQQLTFDFCLVCRRFTHHQCGSFAIERIGWVGICKQLREKDLEDVDHVVHWRPGLIDDIQTNRSGPEQAVSFWEAQLSLDSVILTTRRCLDEIFG